MRLGGEMSTNDTTTTIFAECSVYIIFKNVEICDLQVLSNCKSYITL